jgi:ABC-type multidrug transport system ATPase subunit
VTAADCDLRIEGLRKSYDSLEVLRGVSMNFRPGRVAALVGPNGAGKTTLMRIAAGLQRPDAGTVVAWDAVYFGGFDSLPLGGRIADLRKSLGLQGSGPGDSRRLNRLSRGQLQWVGIEACLDLDPVTLLLDEPWTSLEPDTREELNRLLVARARAGRVVICSTHDLDEVGRVADDVVFLSGGTATWVLREQVAESSFSRDQVLRLFRGGRVEG